MPECRSSEKGETLCLQAQIVAEEIGTHVQFVDLLYLTPYLELGETETEWIFDGEKHLQVSLTWDAKQPSPYLKLFLWPREQPWLQKPYTLDIPQTNAGFAEWVIPLKENPIFKKYGGNFLGIYKVVDPWSSEVFERPLREPQNAIVFNPAYSAKFYRALISEFQAGNASLANVLTLLVYCFRTHNIEQMYHVNEYLCQQAKLNRLKLEQIIFWADVIHDLGDKTLYKITQLTLFLALLLTKLKRFGESSILTELFCSFSDEYATRTQL